MCDRFFKSVRVHVFQLAQIVLNICHLQEGQLCTVMSTLHVVHLLGPNGASINETSHLLAAESAKATELQSVVPD